jgi:seryl-tRNA synthetase
MDGEQEQSKDNIAKQIAINQEQKNQIENLQAKINSFSNNQSQLVEKSRFKASSYMNEINQREEELGRVRANLVDMQEENKQLTVTREKFKAQNVFLAKELKTMELEFNQQKKKIEEQQRLIDNLCVTQKVQNQSLIQSAGGGHDAMM